MKKTNGTANQPHNGKGFFALAGEALHVLGEEIVRGKDKVVDVTAEKFTTVKKAIRKITHKKTEKKKVTQKKPTGASKKMVRKVVENGPSKKVAPVKKKAAAKKPSSTK